MRARKGTAQLVALARAVAHDDPRLLGPDHLAARFLSPLLRWGIRAACVRRFMVDVYRRRAPGGYGWVAARTRAIDELLGRELAAGAHQVVLLGAGYDTRAHRFSDRPGVRFYEADRALLSRRKKRRAEEVLGRPPEHVRYVMMDLESDRLEEALRAAGVERDRRTFFIWEGVTPYLRRSAVEATLRTVSRFAPGSSAVFDYVYRSLVERAVEYRGGAAILRFAAAVGEPFRFGLEPSEAPAFLEAHGLTAEAHLGPDEMRSRYLTAADGTVLEEPFVFAGLMHARVRRP